MDQRDGPPADGGAPKKAAPRGARGCGSLRRMLDITVHRAAHTTLGMLAFVVAACTQGSPPATDAGETTISTTATSKTDSGSASTSLGWREERLGGVGPGSTDAEVTKLLGKPAKASPAQEEGATGELATVWDYPEAGVNLVLAASTKEGPFRVRNLSIAAPSQLKTSKGIGVGSSRAAVERAYAPDLNKELSNDALVVVGTDMYEGIKIRIDNGVVSSITLGGDGE